MSLCLSLSFFFLSLNLQTHPNHTQIHIISSFSFLHQTYPNVTISLLLQPTTYFHQQPFIPLHTSEQILTPFIDPCSHPFPTLSFICLRPLYPQHNTTILYHLRPSFHLLATTTTSKASSPCSIPLCTLPRPAKRCRTVRNYSTTLSTTLTHRYLVGGQRVQLLPIFKKTRFHSGKTKIRVRGGNSESAKVLRRKGHKFFFTSTTS